MIFGKDPSPFPLSHAKAVFADQVRTIGPACWVVLFGMGFADYIDTLEVRVGGMIAIGLGMIGTLDL
jgi:hypothetical protein